MEDGLNTINRNKSAFAAISAFIAVLAFLTAALIPLCGCSKAKLSDTNAMLELVLQNGSFPEMTETDRSVLRDIYGIDLEKLKSISAKTAEDPLKRNEILIIEAADNDSALILQRMFVSRIEGEKRTVENYDPELYSLLMKTEVRCVGSYVFYIVDPDSPRLTALLESKIG